MGWVPRTPHQLCTSPLFRNIHGKPRGVVSVGDGEECQPRACPVLRKMSEDSASQLPRSVYPTL